MRRGQHFLTSRKVLERITGYASLTKDDAVLEIGAGYGNLTTLLTEKAGRVTAIEIDPTLAASIPPRENLKVIIGDALKTRFPPFNKVVSNLPYQISSPLTFKLLSCNFKLGILLYQKEFAQRMVAEPGSRDYSRLSVAVQHFAKPEILETLPPNTFKPHPQVTSALVRLTPRKPPYQITDEKFFLKFLATVFSQRRKKLKNTIQKTPEPNRKKGKQNKKQEGKNQEKKRQPTRELPPDKPAAAKPKTQILNPQLLEKRPEELTPTELAELAETIYQLKA